MSLKMRKKMGIVITMLVLFLFGIISVDGCKKKEPTAKTPELTKPVAPTAPVKPAVPPEVNKPK
jgi:hypothetical protein